MNTTANKQRDSFGKLFDSEFRAKLKSDPANTVTELGYTHTAGVEFVVKENTQNVIYCVLDRTDDAHKLLDEEMSQMAAGVKAGTAGTIACAGSAATAGSVCTTFSSASSAGSLGSVGTIKV